jgi:hypothetical protein
MAAKGTEIEMESPIYKAISSKILVGTQRTARSKAPRIKGTGKTGSDDL